MSNINKSTNELISTIRDIAYQETIKRKVEVPYFGKISSKNLDDDTYKVDFSDSFYVSRMKNCTGHILDVGDSVMVKAIDDNFTNAYIDRVLGENEYTHRWINATLLNSWANYHVDYYNAGYMKDSNGFVHLRGIVKNGTITSGTSILQLPIGYRPSKKCVFSSIAYNSALCTLIIFNDGYLNISNVPNNTWLTLENISFMAEQ